MSNSPTPTENDYLRLQRAVLGVLWIIVLFVVSGFAVQFAETGLTFFEGMFCLLYCAGPIIGIIGVCNTPFNRATDPTHAKFLKGATYGRLLSALSGIGCVVLGILMFLTTGCQFVLSLVWFSLSGLILIVWSFQFPQRQ